MPGRAFTFLMAAMLVYAGLCAALFVFQRALLYLPQPRALVHAPKFSLPVDGAELIVTSQIEDSPQALIYFGGNAEDVSMSLPDLARAFAGQAVYLLHYRGYGGSTGSPSQAALLADALALYDHVRERHEQVAVVGRSLGSSVALHLASRRPIDRLVLVTPFDSIEALASRQFPVFPVRWLLQDKYEAWRDAPQVTAPTRVLVAEHDTIVPRARTDALLAHFRPGVAELHVIEGRGHNAIGADPRYLPLLAGR